MGIIKAAAGAISGVLSEQFLDAVEPEKMDEHTLFTRGKVKGGKKGDVISNGSVIHVYDGQFMILVDGGKIVDYSAEPGYFKVDNSSSPSLLNGEFGETLTDVLNHFKYGGNNPLTEGVYYINLQEVRGIKFGTRNPINYFDNFYNAELFLRAHGTYSIKITNPLVFYQQVVPKGADRLEVSDINDQFMAEFLEGLQSSINQMSAEGTRISFVSSKGAELSAHMAQALDEKWSSLRGIEIVSVALASISYDEESQKLINMRNQGAMMQDPSIREGYVQSAVAQGLQNAGSNANGAAAGYMGINMGMNAASGMMGAASQTNYAQMQAQQAQQQAAAQAAPAADSWTCSCGAVNTGKFCSECGQPKPAPATWTCSCGAVNTGKFCSECGKPRQ